MAIIALIVVMAEMTRIFDIVEVAQTKNKDILSYLIWQNMGEIVKTAIMTKLILNIVRPC